MSYLKKAFGENVKFIRKYRQMTQENLAELIDIDQRQLARIEAGDSFATAETIEKISENLRVSVSDLFRVEKIKTDEMTLEVMENYKVNIQMLNNIIPKIAINNKKTEFICLALEALERKNARERLKGILEGLDLK